MSKKEILLMGAGKIGEMISVLLADSGDYNVTVADFSEDSLARMPKHESINIQQVDATNSEQLQ